MIKVGDKVKVTLEGLQKHARSVPAHLGYTREMKAWRLKLSGFKDQGVEGTVSALYSKGTSLDVWFNGRPYFVPAYMVATAPAPA